MLVCWGDGLKDEDSSYRQARAVGDPEDRLACCYFCFYLPGARMAPLSMRLVVAEGGCCAEREACVALPRVDKSRCCCPSCLFYFL